MKSYTSFICSIMCTFTIINADESCVTVRGLRGKCTLLEECNWMLSKSLTKKDIVNDCVTTANSSTLVCCPERQNKDGCGYAIDGSGRPKDNATFPWVVDVIYHAKQRFVAFDCAGSLINSRFALTAAHCILSVPSRYKPYKVRVDVKPYRKEYVIQKSIVHPKFRTDYLNVLNDIALLKLTENVQFNQFVQPICLPPSRDGSFEMLQSGSLFTIFAVGPLSAGTTKRIKRPISMPLKDTAVCNNFYRILSLQLDAAQLCVGGEPNRDSCRGDSGSPLMLKQQGHWYQIGIVSLGPQQCGGKIPGIYVNLLEYIDWIEETVEANRMEVDLTEKDGN